MSAISVPVRGPVHVLIAVDKEVHRYDATLDDVLDARGLALDSP